MKRSYYPILILIMFSLLTELFATRHLDNTVLWKHVVNVDRLAWQEREVAESINSLSNDHDFVRRIYLDITGKIPTYPQLISFIKSKEVNKREKLIEKLLDTPGYASHFSNFWLDLLRIPYGSLVDFNHKEFNRYIERVLFENKPYDTIVKELILSEGPVQTNPAIGFYRRDYETDAMDTINATIRAFLGTRIGCAQCHNHRFDKWTQKEFYESAAHLWGVRQNRVYSNPQRTIIQFNGAKFKENSKNKKYLSAYSNLFLSPSRASVSYQPKDLKYPDNYVYSNAKPNEVVKDRIVFNYGNLETEGSNPREVFANWLASKDNPMFAKVMANRLWKRIMGAAMMEPIDDWKDNITIKNPVLFDALGEIFIDLNYDFKAFLTVIFNSEAYQLGVDYRNEIKRDDYNFQGSLLKRMSAQQLSDSLLTLQYGDLDRYSKISYPYFEFEDELNALVVEYMKKLVPMVGVVEVRLSKREETVRSDIIDLMEEYLEKAKKIENYHNIGKNGFLKNANITSAPVAQKSNSPKEESMMMGSGSHDQKNILRANYKVSDFMITFGAHDRSSPETTLNTGATMKQVLKMMSSEQCKDVVSSKSQLMVTLNKVRSLSDKINYLYLSIYGRTPSKKEISIAAKYLEGGEKKDLWNSYIVALLNSPEFYFIK